MALEVILKMDSMRAVDRDGDEVLAWRDLSDIWDVNEMILVHVRFTTESFRITNVVYGFFVGCGIPCEA